VAHRLVVIVDGVACEADRGYSRNQHEHCARKAVIFVGKTVFDSFCAQRFLWVVVTTQLANMHCSRITMSTAADCNGVSYIWTPPVTGLANPPSALRRMPDIASKISPETKQLGKQLRLA
jgi:hypothetical protein